MAEGQVGNDMGPSRNIYPALAVAAIAGLALTYFFVSKRSRGEGSQLPIERVVNLCNSAAEKLEAFAAQAIAS